MAPSIKKTFPSLDRKQKKSCNPDKKSRSALVYVFWIGALQYRMHSLAGDACSTAISVRDNNVKILS